MANSYEERFVFSESSVSQLIYDEHLIRYRLAASLASGKRVLDVACGSGYGSKLLAEAGASLVKSVDIDEAVLEEARANYSDDKIEFIADSAEALERITDSSIDLVVSFETIEHLPDYHSYLKNLQRVLAPGGLALISTPNKAVFAQKNPFHIKEFTRAELTDSLARYFTQVRILDQVNGLGSMIKGDNETLANLSSAGVAQYFIAICSNDALPTNIIGQASINQAALHRWQNNPGWKMVNVVYKALVAVRLIRR